MSSIQKVQHSQSFIMFSGAFLLTLGDVSWRRVQWSLCELISPSWRFFSTSRLWMPLSCVYVPSSSGSKVQEALYFSLGCLTKTKVPYQPTCCPSYRTVSTVSLILNSTRWEQPSSASKVNQWTEPIKPETGSQDRLERKKWSSCILC